MYINPKFLVYPSSPFSFGDRKLVFYASRSISVLYVSSFISFVKILHKNDIIFVFVWLTSLCYF